MDVCRVASNSSTKRRFRGVHIAQAQQQFTEVGAVSRVVRVDSHTQLRRLDRLPNAAIPAQYMAQIDLEAADTRGQSNSGTDFLFGIDEVTRLQENSAQQRMAIRIIRLKLHRSLPHRDRLRVPALRAQHRAKLTAEMRVARVRGDCVA